MEENKRKIAIIGGSGALGSWFGKWFSDHGSKVFLHGRNLERLKKAAEISEARYSLDLKETVEDADFVMISVPIKDTPSIIEAVYPYLKENAILFDVASVKEKIIEELIKVSNLKKIRCASIHPMFGPGAKGLLNKKIIMIEFKEENEEKNNNNRSAYLELEKLLTSDKGDLPILLKCFPEEHDKMISFTLGIPHALNILFMNLLSKSGIPLEKISEFGGTTYRIQKILSESVIHESPEIYSQIQMNNPVFENNFKNLKDIISKYLEMIKSMDFNTFRDLFKKLNDYAKNDLDYPDAYEKFYKFLGTL